LQLQAGIDYYTPLDLLTILNYILYFIFTSCHVLFPSLELLLRESN